MDMEGEGKDLSFEQLRAIHLGKTSALLTTSIRFGGFSAGTSPEKLDALTTFGTNLGLAFQVIDDILDVTATSEALGKTAGKDADVGKATYPAILGLDASREEAKKLTAQAIAALTPFGTDAHRLREIASYMLEREY
jgi:geranylgeranyl diphosphate synthase, type II